MTGKPVGDDLREGKPTPLLAIAHEPRRRRRARPLLARVGAGDLEDTEIKALQELLVASGAVDEIERDDRHPRRPGRPSALDAAPLTEPRRASCSHELAIYVAWRDH